MIENGSFGGCGEPGPHSKGSKLRHGLCARHYRQAREQVIADGCSMWDGHCHGPLAKGFCLKHYQANWRQENPDAGRIYYWANREKLLMATRESVARNPEKETARQREYQQRHDVKKKRLKAYRDGGGREKAARHRARNPKTSVEASRKYRAKNPMAVNETVRAYAERNPDKMRAIHRAGRLRRRGASVTRDYLDSEIYERDGWVCQLCDRPIDSSLCRRHHPWGANIDHIIPTSKPFFGPDERSNVWASHRDCNQRKRHYFQGKPVNVLTFRSGSRCSFPDGALLEPHATFARLERKRRVDGVSATRFCSWPGCSYVLRSRLDTIDPERS